MYIFYRNNDGTQTKSKPKILVFKITWCIIIVFCTSSASGVSFCWSGDLVLCKFNHSIYIYVDGLGWSCVSYRLFNKNDELKELEQYASGDGYYSVRVYFSSQFLPYYKSAMKVATLQ